MKLSDIGEFGLIDRIRARLPLPHGPVILGIGDDAAILKPSSGSLTIITTDMLLEEIHFDLSFYTPFQLGYKSLAVNISDIGSMGAYPTAGLISIGLAGNPAVEDIDSLYEGIKESAKEYDISIIGGDTCRSRSGLVLSITLLGEVEDGLAVRRSGAKAGDAIFVTGTLGDSIMGLEILKDRSRFTAHGSRFLMERHLLPTPRVKEGRLIATNKWATSMIDLSDGLTSDLGHICDESSVGAEVYKNKIPTSSELRETASSIGKDPLSYAIQGGEDYELLFTVPKDKLEEVTKAEFIGRPLATMIGEIVKTDRVLIDENGNRRPLVPVGFDHFKK